MEVARRTTLTAASVEDFADRLSKASKASWKTALMAPLSLFGAGSGPQSDYDDLCSVVTEKVQDFARETEKNIENFDFEGIRDRFSLLALVQETIGNHLKPVGDRGRTLLRVLPRQFSSFVGGMICFFEIGNYEQAEQMFASFGALVQELPRNTTSRSDLVGDFDQQCRDLQRQVHSRLLDHTKAVLKGFQTRVDKQDYKEAAESNARLRSLGYFFISTFSLYCNSLGPTLHDANLRSLASITHRRFGSGQIVEIGRYVARLGLTASPTIDDVRKAFRSQSRVWHPDKRRSDEERAKEKFVGIKAAADYLTAEKLDMYSSLDFSYLSEALKKIPSGLSSKITDYLRVHDFQAAVNVCERLEQCDHLLRSIRSESTATILDVVGTLSILFDKCRKVANALKIQIQKAWEEEDFKELHHSCNVLESLETAFKARVEVIPDSVVARVLEELGANLDKLKAKCTDLRGKDELEARSQLRRVGQELLDLGKILDGFPRLKRKTAVIIQNLLADCHEQPWGVTFTFELGLLLENGELTTHEDFTRIGRVIVNSFPQFKDVRTVVFNREVLTAPASQSVKFMNTMKFATGEMIGLTIDREALSAEHKRYEELFMGAFTKHVQHGPAEIVEEVYKILQRVCWVSVSRWDEELKSNLVEILACLLHSLSSSLATVFSGLKRIVVKPTEVARALWTYSSARTTFKFWLFSVCWE